MKLVRKRWKRPKPVLAGRAVEGATALARRSRHSVVALTVVLTGAGCVGALSSDDAGQSGTADAGTADAGTADAGTADAGIADAGTADAGIADAGIADAGIADAGIADAGVADAGTRVPDRSLLWWNDFEDQPLGEHPSGNGTEVLDGRGQTERVQGSGLRVTDRVSRNGRHAVIAVTDRDEPLVHPGCRSMCSQAHARATSIILGGRRDGSAFNIRSVPLGHPILNLPVWYGLSVYFPEDEFPFDADSSFDGGLFDMHIDNRLTPVFPGVPLGNPLGVGVRRGNFRISTRPGIPGVRGRWAVPEEPRIVPNTWYDIVIEARWSLVADGYIRVWINGVQVVEWLNFITVPRGQTHMPYFKYGSAVSWWRRDEGRFPGLRRFVTYVDEVRVAGGPDASYASVDPAAY